MLWAATRVYTQHEANKLLLQLQLSVHYVLHIDGLRGLLRNVLCQETNVHSSCLGPACVHFVQDLAVLHGDMQSAEPQLSPLTAEHQLNAVMAFQHLLA